MNEFKFACPHCQQNLEATPEYSGAQISCPNCQASIVVPDGPTATTPRAGKLTMAASTVQHAATTPMMAATMVRRTKKPRIGLYIGWGVAAAAAVAAIIFVPKALDKYHEHQAAVAAAKELAANPPPPPPPPELEADEILKKVGETYKGFSSYSMQGISVGNIDMSQINPAAKGLQTLTTKLSLRLGRPDLYRMEWTRDIGKQQFKGSVWSSGNGDFIHPANVTTKVKNRETALSTGAGTSGTLGIFIANLFFDETNSMLAALKNYQKTNSETIDGQNCYVLTGKIGSQSVLFWIHKSDFLIAQAERILGGKIDEAALAGLSYAQKAQLEKASKLRGNFIETYQAIDTKKVLNPGDFESDFPPNAVATTKQARKPRAGGGGPPRRGGPQ